MTKYDINKENIRNHRDIKLVTTDRRRRSYLVSGPNFRSIKMFLKEFTGNPNEQNKNKNEQASLFRSVDSGLQKDSNALILVCLCKMKVWRKCMTVLHKHRQLHNTNEI